MANNNPEKVVLIIDDEETFRVGLEQALRLQLSPDVIVHALDNYQDAEAFVRDDPLGKKTILMICDYSGVQAFNLNKRIERPPHAIIVSGWDRTLDIGTKTSGGLLVVATFTKPFNLGEFF